MVHLQRNPYQPFQSLNTSQDAPNLFLPELPHQSFASPLQSTAIDHLSLQCFQRLLELIKRPFLDCQRSHGPAPWLIGIAFSKSTSQVNKKAIEIRELNLALHTVFRSFLNVV